MNIINKIEDIIVIHLLRASLSVYYFTTRALNFYLITKAESRTELWIRTQIGSITENYSKPVLRDESPLLSAWCNVGCYTDHSTLLRRQPRLGTELLRWRGSWDLHSSRHRQVSVAMVSVASRPLAYLLALTMARPQAACCHESQEQLRREKLLPLEVTAQLPTALPWENSAMNGIAEWKIH